MSVGMIMLPLDDLEQAQNVLSTLQGYMLTLLPLVKQGPGAVARIQSLQKVEARLSRIIAVDS